MTDLDELGTWMLNNEQFNWLADHFSNKYPMRLANGNGNLQNFSSIQVDLEDEQVVVLFLQPNESAMYCDRAVAER